MALIALAALIAFVALEGRLRVGLEARSLEATSVDRGTTRRVGLAFGLSAFAVVISMFLSAVGVGTLTDAVGPIGLVLMVAGIWLRVWSARTLGASYTRTLRMNDTQRLVQVGPYRVLRHPGYAGVIVMWLGAGLATTNWLVLLFIVGLTVTAYLARVAAEEAMLASVFGDQFRAYASGTWRLVPLLY